MNKLKKNSLKYFILIVVIVSIGILAYRAIDNFLDRNDKNFVEMGYIENSKTYTGYIIKEENVIDIDYSKTSVPIIAEGQRASKNQIVAMYRGDDYAKNSEKLAQMDSEILEANKNLPEIYSSEVQSMDSDILNDIKKIENETAYVKIQDSKVMINNLLNKRAKVIAENSPGGAAVKSLIAARNSYEESTKTSKDNIKATTGGVISYKLDGLENPKAFNNLGAIDISDIKEKIKTIKSSNGIKIVNNYEAYILLEVKDVDKKYLEIGKQNKIRIVGLENMKLEGTIYRVRDIDENTYEIMYKITNNIEDLAGLREIELEIVWVSSYGLYVPNEAIQIKDDVSYITILKYGENVEVPVKVSRKNDKYTIIANIEDKAKITGTWEDYNLKVYDQLVIPNIGNKTS